MKLPLEWLSALVAVPEDAEAVARTLGLRGFEVASIETSPHAVIDFEITANRPDCLSILGLAREASAAFDRPLTLPPLARLDGSSAGNGPAIDVRIEDAERCPRYCAQVFEVRSLAPAPAWMRDRLEAAGVRSINPIVDVTNYVMLEIGQPTHAFDLARLAGAALRIRGTRAGETLRTLDEVDRALAPGTLVIADAERPQAIAGVMGGAASEIGSATTRFVLESACFQPAAVRRTSRALGLKTEASARFERGADINAAPAAIARAAALFEQIGAARTAGPSIDIYPAPRPPLTLPLRSERITRVLGMPVSDESVTKILTPLGFEVHATTAEQNQNTNANANPEPRTQRTAEPPHPRTAEPRGTAWRVTVPSFRVDVMREIDLIEEVARHDGYASLPATFPELAEAQPPADARTLRDRAIRHLLTACGMSEAMAFAFIERAAALPFTDGAEPAPLANPLSEKYAVLRPSLLPGLIDAAAHNRRRERKDVRLFETGTRFTAAGEGRAVAGIWAGAGATPHWAGHGRAVDFYDVKGLVEALLRALRIEAEFEPVSRPYLVEGRAASVRLRASRDAGILGVLGQLTPTVLEARGFPGGESAFAFELDVDAAAAAQPAGDLRAASLPRFPAVVRDLSILVSSSLPAATVRGTIRAAAPAALVDVTEFDRYRGAGVPEGRVSLSLRLTFRSPDRTLTDAEVDAAMNGIVAALASTHDAQRR